MAVQQVLADVVKQHMRALDFAQHCGDLNVIAPNCDGCVGHVKVEPRRVTLENRSASTSSLNSAALRV